MPADLCPADSRGAIAIASAEMPGKAMTSLFKKKKKKSVRKKRSRDPGKHSIYFATAVEQVNGK